MLVIISVCNVSRVVCLFVAGWGHFELWSNVWFWFSGGDDGKRGQVIVSEEYLNETATKTY